MSTQKAKQENKNKRQKLNENNLKHITTLPPQRMTESSVRCVATQVIPKDFSVMLHSLSWSLSSHFLAAQIGPKNSDDFNF